MNDFDFLVGEWDVAHDRLVDFLDPDSGRQRFSGVSRCWSLFAGAANVDEADCPDQGFKGLTLRLFDRETKEWSLNWSNSTVGRLDPPVRGRFRADGVGEFHGDDTYAGRAVRVRFLWSGITDRTARWEQAFSVDGGANWTTNWTMDFTRRA
ncbi:hypothetical protein OG322_26865 [Streptomyces sp. NBC_01260]|uniref:hypothetical protein n=1 Tax=unclassified Streptomyces TaxID=2593676 RepID=UPI000F48BB1C|nr:MULTISPECIES: hypothetical protein [unclassified Streptomyces]MCX4772857.1 hypothetical protein [Streptomyces sp. NBC_01285]ROQ71174.1 hypothetical protein EDD95_7266 [Streptomyces sp. CEV 2-1]RPK51876.1 hypothetical protein EES39_03055 [Streptomyces sp. ADI92-24]